MSEKSKNKEARAEIWTRVQGATIPEDIQRPHPGKVWLRYLVWRRMVINLFILYPARILRFARVQLYPSFRIRRDTVIS